MISLRSAFAAVLPLTMLGMIVSCNVAQSPDTTTPHPETAAPAPDEELRRMLKDANLQGFQFGMQESDSSVTTSFTNGAVRDLINLDSIEAMPLRYTSVRDKKSRETKSYRTDVVKKDGTLSLAITDLATGGLIETRPFPAADDPGNPTTSPPAGGFDSLQQCIAAFNCEHGGRLQCEANRTCKDQPAATTCCLKSGECDSVHLNVRPTAPRCLISDLVPNFEGLVLSRK